MYQLGLSPRISRPDAQGEVPGRQGTLLGQGQPGRPWCLP